MVNPTITVRLSENELARLDELARRMNKTRSDVIRDLVNNFDEALRQEVERERKRWIAVGFVAALESEILDPEVVLRFVRRNVDVLGYPDFLIGTAKVRNRVVVFSHQDKVGHQLLQLVRAKVEEEVRREEAEIEREEDEGDDEGSGVAMTARLHVKGPTKLSTVRAAPGIPRYKLVSSNKSATPIPKPTATTTVGRPGNSGGSGGAEATANTSVPEKQKLVAASQPNTGSPANSQPRNPNPQASADGSGKDAQKPAGQGANHGLAGDFVLSLVTHSYHKYRSELLRLVESIVGG